MKRSLSLLAAAAFVALISDAAMAQATATQTVSLSVSAVQLIAVSNSAVTLTIDGTSAVAGTNAVGSASDNSTTYSITHNGASNLRITAAIDAVMPSGTSLSLGLANAGGNGASAGTVVLSTTAQDVVTGIAAGVVAGETISYTFAADASAGQFSGSRTVTLTLTN
jgi:hypothetical protein